MVRSYASDEPRDPRESWFLRQGPADLQMSEIALGYRRRYSHEHGYRFDEQSLLWTRPRLRTSEQFERWSQIIAFVHNQLVLAATPRCQPCCVPGKTSSVRRLPSRCGGLWRKLWYSWGPLPGLRNHAENRPAGQKARSCDLFHAIRWCASPNQRPKSGGNRRNCLTTTLIVCPFRTSVPFASRFA